MREKEFHEKIESGFWATIPSNFCFEKSVGFFRRVNGRVEYIDVAEDGSAMKFVCCQEPQFASEGNIVSLMVDSVCDVETPPVPEDISDSLNVEVFHFSS